MTHRPHFEKSKPTSKSSSPACNGNKEVDFTSTTNTDFFKFTFLPASDKPRPLGGMSASLISVGFPGKLPYLRSIFSKTTLTIVEHLQKTHLLCSKIDLPPPGHPDLWPTQPHFPAPPFVSCFLSSSPTIL